MVKNQFFGPGCISWMGWTCCHHDQKKDITVDSVAIRILHPTELGSGNTIQVAEFFQLVFLSSCFGIDIESNTTQTTNFAKSGRRKKFIFQSHQNKSDRNL